MRNVVCVMPKRVRAHRHHLRKMLLVAAHQLAERRGRVVGRLGDQAEQRLLDRQRRARHQSELGRRHRRGRGAKPAPGRSAKATVAQRLEQPDRSSSAWSGWPESGIRPDWPHRDHLARLDVDHDRGVAVGADLRVGCSWSEQPPASAAKTHESTIAGTRRQRARADHRGLSSSKCRPGSVTGASGPCPSICHMLSRLAC